MRLLNTLTSKQAMKLLKTLSSGSKHRREIAKFMDTSKASLSQIIRKLTDSGLIEGDGGLLELTSKGKLVVAAHNAMEGYGKFIDAFGDYANKYLLNDIPDFLLLRVFELNDVEIIVSDRRILRPHPEVISSVKNSEFIFGYAPVIYPDYVKLFLGIAKEGIDVEVVVSKHSFSKLKAEFEGDLDGFVHFENTRLFVAERDFRFSFILTDSALYMSFFFRNGLLDYTRFFAWKDKSALRWGRDLFEYVKSQSQVLVSY